ncbi:MAG: 50S ribosomal protein L10 [Cyclobacteriaceae bacterium]|nr:MAG: 50S ribosomal protein L10 [Cyclobacteriaceae bacterium]
MTRAEKQTIVEELYQKFSETNHFYITDPQGLNVERVNNFRRMCFNKGIEYKVYKNTLIKKALEKLDTDYSSFDDTVLKGFSGILFSGESSNIPAKIIKEFRKSAKSEELLPLLKGASIDTDLFIGEEYLDTLSKLKSKAELIGEVISLLQSPAKNVVSALQSGPQTLAGLVKTLSEREG